MQNGAVCAQPSAPGVLASAGPHGLSNPPTKSGSALKLGLVFRFPSNTPDPALHGVPKGSWGGVWVCLISFKMLLCFIIESLPLHDRGKVRDAQIDTKQSCFLPSRGK